MTFPELGKWHASKSVLHEISRVLSAVPRRFLPAHRHWWHISVKLRGGQLSLDPVPLPDGRNLNLTLDLRQQVVRMAVGEMDRTWVLDIDTNAAALAEALFEELARLGLVGLDPVDFQSMVAQGYRADEGERFLDMLITIERLFLQHITGRPGRFGPVQLWPHGFDFSVEWYGARRAAFQESGETKSAPVQLNLGWSPGEASHPAPYFYSNPWPFDPEFQALRLPAPARWFTGSWQGTILPYAALIGRPDAEELVLGYASSVYDLLTPRLESGPQASE